MDTRINYALVATLTAVAATMGPVVNAAAAEPAPVVVDDRSDNHTPGDAVQVAVLDNDSNVVASTLKVADAASGALSTSTTVAGEGTWTVNPTSGVITFTPETGFTGTTSPLAYAVSNADGFAGSGYVTVAYADTVPAPVANDDMSSGHSEGVAVTVDVVSNDQNVEAGTVALVDPGSGECVSTVDVPGIGAWTVNSSDEVTFTPNSSFSGNPAPVTYCISNAAGVEDTARVTVTYVQTTPAAAAEPDAINDESVGNTEGDAVTLSVASNDANVEASTVRLVDSDGGLVTSMTADGQGEWTVNSLGQVTFTPEAGFNGDPTPVTYSVASSNGDRVQATITLSYVPTEEPQPEATDDESLNNEEGAVVTLSVAQNDANVEASTVRLVDSDGGLVTSMTAEGQGEWTVNSSGEVTFTPDDTFFGDPTPVTYSVASSNGDRVEATITVTYVQTPAPAAEPAATDDESLNNEEGAVVTLSVTSNDQNVDGSTVRLVDPDGGLVTSMTADGQGEWTVNSSGQVTFTPDVGFVGDPTPVTYSIASADGDRVEATVTVTYLHPAAPLVEPVDDQSLNNVAGESVTVSVTGNDTNVDPTTVRVVDPVTGGLVTTLSVAGEGEWVVDAATGEITFTPEDGFVGDPTPVTYNVANADGVRAAAELVVGYEKAGAEASPAAEPVSSTGNKPGDTVTVSVADEVSNADLDTIRIVDPVTGELVTTLSVEGEGEWKVASSGEITFAPEDGFTGNPTPVTYSVANDEGKRATAEVEVAYESEAAAATPSQATPTAATPSTGTSTNAAQPGVEKLAFTGASTTGLGLAGLWTVLAGFVLMASRKLGLRPIDE